MSHERNIQKLQENHLKPDQKATTDKPDASKPNTGHILYILIHFSRLLMSVCVID